MNRERIVWALLTTATVQQLTKQVSAFRRERLGERERFVEQWEVVACKDDCSAVINREAGTRHTHEGALAERISSELSKPVHIVYADAAFFGSEGLEVYEGGSYVRDLADDPDEFLRTWGFPFLQRRKEARSPIRSVVVVEGIDAASAARALGFAAAPQTSSLRITDGLVGAVISSSTVDDLSTLTYTFSKEFPKPNIYKLSTGPTPGRFLAWMVRRGKNLGSFEYPDAGSGGTTSTQKLDAIRGQKTPASISEALGVPPELLDL